MCRCVQQHKGDLTEKFRKWHGSGASMSTFFACAFVCCTLEHKSRFDPKNLTGGPPFWHFFFFPYAAHRCGHGLRGPRFGLAIMSLGYSEQCHQKWRHIHIFDCEPEISAYKYIESSDNFDNFHACSEIIVANIQSRFFGWEISSLVCWTIRYRFEMLHIKIQNFQNRFK